jgi:hypothetical protein
MTSNPATAAVAPEPAAVLREWRGRRACDRADQPPALIGDINQYRTLIYSVHTRIRKIEVPNPSVCAILSDSNSRIPAPEFLAVADCKTLELLLCVAETLIDCDIAPRRPLRFQRRSAE